MYPIPRVVLIPHSLIPPFSHSSIFPFLRFPIPTKSLMFVCIQDSARLCTTPFFTRVFDRSSLIYNLYRLSLDFISNTTPSVCVCACVSISVLYHVQCSSIDIGFRTVVSSENYPLQYILYIASRSISPDFIHHFVRVYINIATTCGVQFDHKVCVIPIFIDC